jgi:hypothetical protein
VNKFRIFLSYGYETKKLFIEAVILLGWARVLKSLPFKKVHPSLGIRMEETPYEINESNLKILKQISYAINIMSSYTFWESKCLVQAIAAMKMLERRKIESTLYLGTSINENGKMIAHAWLRSGSIFLTGANEMEDFVVVCKFAKKI